MSNKKYLKNEQKKIEKFHSIAGDVRSLTGVQLVEKLNLLVAGKWEDAIHVEYLSDDEYAIHTLGFLELQDYRQSGGLWDYAPAADWIQ